MRYLIGLLLFVFLFSVLAYTQETSTGNAGVGLPVKGNPVNSALSPNASVPNKISYQGLLTTTGGVPVADGAYELKFELFSVSGGGVALWSETQPGVNVYKGTFSVLLGAVTPLTDIFNQPLWVEVTAVSGPGIAASTVFTPRTELASAAYSLGPVMKTGDNYYVQSDMFGISQPPEYPFILDAVNDVSFIRAKSTDGWSGVISDKKSATDNNYFILRTNGIDKWTLGTMGSNDFSLLHWPAYPNPYLVVDTLGKVGIGTTTPQSLLDVAGPVHVGDTLFIGSPTQNGVLNLYQNGTTQPTLYAGPFSDDGGQLQIKEEGGITYLYAQPDVSGTGGYFEVDRTTGVAGFVVDGNYSSTGQPLVGIYGTSRSAIFNMSQTEDNSVALPDNSISSTEILDEPGVAQQNTSSIINIPSTTMTDIDTISVTIPSSGYIVLEASGFTYLLGTTEQNQLYAQIDETAGGNLVSPNWTKVGLGSYASTASNFFQVFCTRTYYKTAGTYAFRFEASQVGGNGSGSSTNIYMTQLRAAYYPTSYGQVNASVSQSEASQFESINLKTGLLDQSDENTSQSETFYNVDLRDLEIKAMKARVEADKAERELLEAQMKQQQATGSEPR